MQPYSYFRAKGCLPIGAGVNMPLWQAIVARMHLSLKTDFTTVLTTYYRYHDFKINSAKTFNLVSDCLHGTACDFDRVRSTFPWIDEWWMILGNVTPPLSGLDELQKWQNGLL